MKFGRNIVTDGLVLAIDAANQKSYPGSGTSVYDISGNSHIGVLNNGTTTSSTSFIFDGTNDAVTIPNNTSINLNTEFSVQFWVKITDLANSHQLVSKGLGLYGNADVGWAVSYYSVTQRIYFDTYSSTPTRYASIQYYTEPYNINPTSWNNITCIFKTNSYKKMFFNGIPVLTTSPMTHEIGNTNYDFLLSYTTGWPPLTGEIGEVLYYNRQLTDSEILQNYNATKARFGL